MVLSLLRSCPIRSLPNRTSHQQPCILPYNLLSLALEAFFSCPCFNMANTSIQDRTTEFRSILTQAQKRQSSTKGGGQRASLLSDAQKREANGSAAPNGERRARSEFARNAAQIGRGITATMGKLERLAQCTYSRKPTWYNCIF